MDVKFEKTSPTLATITVDIVPDDYTAKIKSELKRIGTTQNIPGFRKGHVDINYLTKRFGKEVKSDVINHIVADAALDYLKDNKIDILAQPMPVNTPTEITMDANPYSFSYEVALVPEIDVELDKNVTLPYYRIDVTQSMVEEQDKMLRERFGTQEPGEEADEKALIKGTLMELDAEGNVKETEDAIQVINGIVAPMYFKDKDEAAKFLHCHVNDKIVFNPWKSCEGNAAELSSMLNIADKEKAAEVRSDFQMTVAEIIVLKPAELGDEFYKQVFGPEAKIESEEMYLKAVKSLVESQYIPSQEVVFQNTAHKYLMSTYAPKIELANDFLKKWVSLNNPDLTAEQLESDMEKIINDTKWMLIRDAANEKLNVKVTEQDYLGYAVQLARRQFAQYGMTNYPADVYEDYGKKILSDAKSRRQIEQQVDVIALFSAVKNAITVDVKTVSVEEFQEIGKKSEED